MGWLRLDDRFGTSPKLDGLSEAQRWRWVLVLLYCAQHETDGLVTLAVLKRIGLKRDLLVRLELLEERVDGGLFVHDFLDYNPSKGDRELTRERWRDRKRASRERADVTGGVTGESQGVSRGESHHLRARGVVTEESFTRNGPSSLSSDTPLVRNARGEISDDENAELTRYVDMLEADLVAELGLGEVVVGGEATS